MRTSSSRSPAASIRTAAFCRQRSAVRRYASSSSRPMFSRNGSGVEDNPSIRHVEVRALPHESGPSSCARGSPHWVLLETKTSRRRNALRSCSRTQNVKLRLSTWSGSTKTERSQVGVTRVPGISSRPIRRRPSSVRTAASPPSTICPAGRRFARSVGLCEKLRELEVHEVQCVIAGLVEAVACVDQIARPHETHHYEELISRYRSVRLFLPKLLELPFEGIA